MDMDAASTSNHHQGYRNESHEPTQSQTAHIDCKSLQILEPRDSARDGEARKGGVGGIFLAAEDLEEHQNFSKQKKKQIERK